MAAVVVAAGSARCGAQAPALGEFANGELKDLEVRVKVVKADQSELARISRDFAMLYRLKDVTMYYKAPSKVRMESSVGMLVFNGPTRLFRVPQLRLTKKDDLGDSPGKRYSLLEIGIVTQSDLSAMTTRFLKTDNLEGTTASVFEVTYKGDNTLRYVIWINPATRLVMKREWYDASGALRATFRFLDPREVQPGLWVPTRIEILNPANTVAGITSYTELKINRGLDEALFEIT